MTTILLSTSMILQLVVAWVALLASSSTLLFLSLPIPGCEAFAPPASSRSVLRRQPASSSSPVAHHPSLVQPGRLKLLHRYSSSKEEEEQLPLENPYADPNYPDLEFVNYADPEYQVDQGGDEEYFTNPNNNREVEEEIELMREERRRRNDEYQFQTYFSTIHQNGRIFQGEWTVYTSSSFVDDEDVDANGLPRLLKAYPKPLQVQSRAYKTFLGPEERIVHEEQVLAAQAQLATEDERLLDAYWPEPLQMQDFRGAQGIMVVGNAYTTASAVPLHHPAENKIDINDDDMMKKEGPYREYRAEVGIQSDALRFRVKLNYAVPPDQQLAVTTATTTPPPLLLKTLVVCREQQTRDNQWVSSTKEEEQQEPSSQHTSFGATAGAPGGLYDPPPVGDTDQASQYMFLDLQGRASLLFPYRMDQTPEAFGGNGWVTSLDWTPANMRFQVDRKVHGGRGILGLRTLELSEVLGQDADTYRPRDGGRDMRQ